MKRYQYEQLDADTKAYLRFVRDGSGRGAPGIFLKFKSGKPTWAFLVGLVVLPLFLWLAYTSSKAGWAVAMLQTAGVLLGGWLIVFAFRRWMGNPDKYAGHFAYFDPEHAFYGMGEEIQIARIGRDPEVEPRGETGVWFSTERGSFTVPTTGRVVAQYVTDFYEALKWVRSRTDGTWVGLNSAEAGAVARYLVEEDREPNTVADTGLEVEEIPDRVEPKPAGFGFMRLLILAGITAGVYVLFATTNPAIQDDLAFEAAKSAVAAERERNANPAEKPENKGFTGAFAVRDYLLNDKHTRHRDAAKKLLSDLYAAPIAQVQAGRDALPENDTKTKALRDAVVKLLEELRTLETPAVSFRIKLNGAEMTDERGKQTRSLFADGFATAVGKDLVLGCAAGEGKTAHIEVNYQPLPNAMNSYRWTVEVRTSVGPVPATPEDKLKNPPLAVLEGSVQITGGQFDPFGGGMRGGAGQRAFPDKQMFGGGDEAWSVDEPLKDVLAEDDAVYRAVMTKLLGFAPERPRAPQ